MALRNLLIIFGLIAIAASMAGLVALRIVPPSRVETVVVPVEPDRAETTHILRARRTIAAGSFIGASDIVSVMVEAPAPAEAISGDAETAKTLEGAVARQDIAQGDVILLDQVWRRSERGFLTAILTPSMRAMPIAVKAVGAISPGDRVDVVLSQVLIADDSTSPRKAVAETILQDRRVIAVENASSITLEVDAGEAQVLSVAMSIGTLNVAVRSADDRATPGEGLPPQASWASDVSSALERSRSDVRAPPQRRGPIILRGGKDVPTGPVEN